MMATLSITVNFKFAQEVAQPTDYSGQLESILTFNWTWDQKWKYLGFKLHPGGL